MTSGCSTRSVSLDCSRFATSRVHSGMRGGVGCSFLHSSYHECTYSNPTIMKYISPGCVTRLPSLCMSLAEFTLAARPAPRRFQRCMICQYRHSRNLRCETASMDSLLFPSSPTSESLTLPSFPADQTETKVIARLIFPTHS